MTLTYGEIGAQLKSGEITFNQAVSMLQSYTESEKEAFAEKAHAYSRQNFIDACMNAKEISMSYLDSSEIPERFKDADINACDPKALHFAKTAYSTKENLMLTGSFGVGKSYTACAILNFYGKEHSVKYMNMVDFLRNYSSVIDSNYESLQSYYEKFAHTEMLLIDDLGKGRPTEGSIGQLWSIVDYRFREQLPTIITTNYNGKTLFERLSSGGDVMSVGAIMDRFKEYQVVEIQGVSRRGA